MGNRVDRFMAFLVIVVALSVWGAGIALSQTLSLDDQSAMAVEDSVTFTLSLDNPSSGGEIQSLTADVCYDPTVLTYDSNTRGSLIGSIEDEEGWRLFGVNDTEAGSECTGRVLKIAGLAGFDLVDFSPIPGIPAGASGAVVELHFTVKSEANDTLMLDSLDGFDTRDGEFTFELPPPNRPPTVNPITVSSTGQSVVIDVLGHMSVSDPDGDALMVSAVGLAASGTAVDNNDGTITYTPDSGFVGSDNFTYTVSDGMDSSTEMVTVNVTEPPNTAPTPDPDPDPAMTDVGESVVIRVSDYVSDPDGDTLMVSAVGLAANGTVVNNDDGTITYTPTENYSGEDQFTFTVSDGDASVDVVVDITVEAAEPVEPVDPGTGDNGDSDGGSDGGGCTLNPGARFDPTLVSVLALFMGIHSVRRFTRRQSLR